MVDPQIAEVAGALAASHAATRQCVEREGTLLKHAYELIFDPPNEDPPFEDPPFEDQPFELYDPPDELEPLTFPSEAEYGCPAALDLIDWTHAQVNGAGCPAGVRTLFDGTPFDGGDVGDSACGFSGFQFRREAKGSDRGLLSGVGAGNDGVRFSNGRVLGARKWAANGWLKGASFERCSFLGTEVEHDVYVKLNGGGSGLVCRWLYSRNTASQCLQVAKRSWEAECTDFGPGGPVIVHDWLAINHGGGERESQAFKVFSAQEGAGKDDWKWVQLPHDVALRRLWLDDSMRPTCMGAAFVGDARSFVLDGLHAVGGELLQHAVEVFPGEGPAYVGGLDLWYASAEGGRGVLVHDLDRPLMIPPGAGNLRIIGPSGETLSHVRDGYDQHWSGAALEVKP